MSIHKRVSITTVIIFLASTCAVSRGALVAHWPLNEGSGDKFTDVVGGNDGFLPPDVEVEWSNDGPPGIQNVSVEFVGDIGPSYIETPFEGIGGADPRTITLWVKADPQPFATAMVAWGSLDTSRKWHFRINQGSNSLRTEFSGGQNFAEIDMADGDWHFVASVFPDGAIEGLEIEHYLDGEQDFQLGGTSLDIDTAIDPNEGAFPVHIGLAAGHDGRFFVGQIADVRIYDEGLDQAALLAIMSGADLATLLQPGDADHDLDFDQIDLVQVQIAAKYLSGTAATWGEGDWNGGPGGSQGNPPAGDGQFNQLDVISALGAGVYLTGPYGAIAAGGVQGDGQTSVGYNPGTGEVFVDAPAGTELTSINIDSAAGVFTGQAAQNLGGSFDNDADANIFKATFGGSFGSLSFGNVAQSGLDNDFVLADLTVVGSLSGGGDLGNVDLIYVPEPSGIALLCFGFLGLLGWSLWREMPSSAEFFRRHGQFAYVRSREQNPATGMSNQQRPGGRDGSRIT